MYREVSMKQFIFALTAMLFACCSSDNETQAETLPSPEAMTISITIDGQTRTVSLVSNAATRELADALRQGAITYEAHDYGGFEKVGALGRSLPTSNEQITTEAGDVVLYNGNQIVLFYGSNSWSYTRLGRIEHESLNDLKAFLKAGQGSISVTLSAAAATGISHHVTTSSAKEAVYTLNGQKTDRPAHGVYIKNGRKVVL